MRMLVVACLCLCSLVGCTRPSTELARRGDEIVVCGHFFHTGTPVVLWMDPGGYDAYRTEKRFVPWAKAPFAAPAKGTEGPASPNRCGVRFVPSSPGTGTTEEGAAETAANADEPSRLTPEEFERVRGGGWDLPLLQQKVDQFVLHYDVAGTSRQCFRTLHDVRGLSVHFMLDIDGTIYQTMDVKERAWHATIANDRSVGVEIANIGAYPDDQSTNPLSKWYDTEESASGAQTRITLPAALGDGGVRTVGFVGRPARKEPVIGEIQGKQYRQYDFTPEQYASLVRLAATLHLALPRIDLDYPRDAAGQLVTHALTRDECSKFHGVLGHYHIQENKIDPGPAMQWDAVINDARRIDALPTLKAGAPAGASDVTSPAKYETPDPNRVY
jgi:N-acetyl-anhydromuramyl-L-alanine amidase AmpD